jgi:hypothetical protein
MAARWKSATARLPLVLQTECGRNHQFFLDVVDTSIAESRVPLYDHIVDIDEMSGREILPREESYQSCCG